MIFSCAAVLQFTAQNINGYIQKQMLLKSGRSFMCLKNIFVCVSDNIFNGFFKLII